MLVVRKARLPYARRWLRLLAYVACLQAVAMLVTGYAVRAQVDRALLGAGDRMMQFGEQGPSARTLRINGASLRLRVETVHGHSAAEIMNTFAARCRDHNGRLFEELLDPKHKLPLTEDTLGIWDGVWRSGDDHAGAVACLDTGKGKLNAQSMLQRISRFADSGDVADVGQMRFLKAQQVSADSTLLVMYWTEGELNVRHMFPPTGDAPGIDFAGVPRPPQARRVLSAWEEGTDPAINIYTTSALDGAGLDAFYRERLAKDGWQFMNPAHQDPRAPKRGVLAMRDGIVLTIASLTDEHGRGVATVMPMHGGIPAQAP